MYLTQSLHRSLQQIPTARPRSTATGSARWPSPLIGSPDWPRPVSCGCAARRSRRHPRPELRPLPGVLLRGAVDGSRGQPGEHPVECRRDRLLAGRFRHPGPVRRRRIRTDDSHTARTVSGSACRDLLRRRRTARRRAGLRDADRRARPRRGHPHRRRRVTRRVLHRRHHRSPQRRDALAQQPAHLVDGQPRLRSLHHAARPITAHRAAVSSRRHRGMGRGMLWSAPRT